MVEYTRSHTRGGARKKVGRTERISFGNLDRLSENHTGNPCRTGTSSTTTHCAIWAEGRNAMVTSSGVSGRTDGAVSIFDTSAPCVTRAIFGSPVAPEVIYSTAAS